MITHIKFMQTQERQPLSAPPSSLCLLHNRTDDATRFGYLCSFLLFLSIWHDGTMLTYLGHDTVGVPLKGIILLCAIGTIAANDAIQTMLIYLRHDTVSVPLKGIILFCAIGTIAANDEIQTMLHCFFETQICTKSTTHLQTQREKREWGEDVLISNRSRSCRVRECRLVLLEVE